MIGIRLSKDANGDYDMLMTNGKFEMAEDGTAAACAVLTRLRMFRTECLVNPIVNTTLNPLAGVDFYGIIFSAYKTKAEKELELKRVIMSKSGIYSIRTWQWTQTARSVAIACTVQTDWGDIDVSQVIEPL